MVAFMACNGVLISCQVSYDITSMVITEMIPNQRSTRLTAAFIRNVKTPGRYGDGRGGYGLILFVKPLSAGG